MKEETDKLNPIHISFPDDIARARFMKPDELFVGNYSDTDSPELDLPTIEELVERLMQSGRFSSVRVDPNAVFDSRGRPYPGAVAIFVIPKPAPQG